METNVLFVLLPPFNQLALVIGVDRNQIFNVEEIGENEFFDKTLRIGKPLVKEYRPDKRLENIPINVLIVRNIRFSNHCFVQTDIDGKLDTINQNLNTKVDASTVDSKIETAKTDILADAAEAAATALSEKVGAIEEGTTIKEYVDNAVGSGGVDVAEQIAQAKAEAISESKSYTDSLLTVVEF